MATRAGRPSRSIPFSTSAAIAASSCDAKTTKQKPHGFFVKRFNPIMTFSTLPHVEKNDVSTASDVKNERLPTYTVEETSFAASCACLFGQKSR